MKTRLVKNFCCSLLPNISEIKEYYDFVVRAKKFKAGESKNEVRSALVEE